MADAIVFKYEEMQKAAQDIRDIAQRYKSAANTLDGDFKSAVQGWEGDSKDAMVKFISGPVMEYTRDTVPQLLEALAALLDSNVQQMKNADAQIAANIPTSL